MGVTGHLHTHSANRSLAPLNPGAANDNRLRGEDRSLLLLGMRDELYCGTRQMRVLAKR